MKKIYNLSVFYAILGIVGGIFFREFTKLNNFSGVTTLSFVHTHAFVLGMIFFLIVVLLEKQFQLSEHTSFSKFLIFYNTGVVLTISMLLVRGITQVLDISLSSGMNAAISGISGLSHIVLTLGFIFFYLILKKQISIAK